MTFLALLYPIFSFRLHVHYSLYWDSVCRSCWKVPTVRKFNILRTKGTIYENVVTLLVLKVLRYYNCILIVNEFHIIFKWIFIEIWRYSQDTGTSPKYGCIIFCFWKWKTLIFVLFLNQELFGYNRRQMIN